MSSLSDAQSIIKDSIAAGLDYAKLTPYIISVEPYTDTMAYNIRIETPWGVATYALTALEIASVKNMGSMIATVGKSIIETLLKMKNTPTAVTDSQGNTFTTTPINPTGYTYYPYEGKPLAGTDNVSKNCTITNFDKNDLAAGFERHAKLPPMRIPTMDELYDGWTPYPEHKPAPSTSQISKLTMKEAFEKIDEAAKTHITTEAIDEFFKDSPLASMMKAELNKGEK